MTNQEHKKILLAVDGSDRSLETVRYVSKIPSFSEMGVVLFHDFSKVPEHYWDMGREASRAWRLSEVAAWERENEKRIQDHVERAKKTLWRAGFPKDTVKVKIHEWEEGIARDIAQEANRGYSCVIVGRKGMSQVKDLVLGSVSTKLIEKLSFVPLVVVGRNPQPGTLLLALDGSENSMRTVDYLAATLSSSNFEVTLTHVIRGNNGVRITEAKEAITEVFDEAKSRLVESGIESNQITTKIITGAHSRAGAILKEAKQGGYGTIVVGRRGLSQGRDFFIGRVSNKLIHMAKNQAVWVVD